MRLELGLIGKKLQHSFSQGYFSEKMRSEHVSGHYHNFELADISAVEDLLRVQDELRGFNVTIPYKESIIPYLDVLSEMAENVGAVNTVLNIGGKLEGFNTDVIGFRDSLAEFYPEGPGGKALILGTGGASKAIAYVLEHFFMFDAVEFASRNPAADGHFSYDALAKTGLQDYRLIVNTTPVGTFPNGEESLELPYDTLGKSQYFFDLVYNPAETTMMKKARAQGAQVTNGMDMLIRQAEASWQIWTSEL